MLKIVEPVLPKEMFSVEVKPQLLAQSIRVFLSNQRQGTQSAQTRADVSRTRKKIFKQKGTGHARHGDRRSPIFVGGGVAFAPKPRDYELSFNKKMKTMAKAGALSLKNKEGNLLFVEGMDKLTGKTKEFVEFIKTVVKADSEKKLLDTNILVITDKVRDNVVRAVRNIKGLDVAPMNLVNAYQIVKSNKVIMMAEAIEENKSEKAEKKTEEVEKASKTKTVAKKVVKKAK